MYTFNASVSIAGTPRRLLDGPMFPWIGPFRVGSRAGRGLSSSGDGRRLSRRTKSVQNS
jgi:uncharacterized membrane protein